MGAKVVNFEIVQFSGARIIGKSTRVKEPTTLDDLTVNGLLDMMEKEGHYEFLLNLSNKFKQTSDTVGWQGDYNPGDTSYVYLVGVMFKPDTLVPIGYDYRDIKPCEMAVAWIQESDGDEGGDLFGDASGNLAKVRDEHGYTYDGSNGFFEMEYYSEERFKIPQKQSKGVVLDFYSPCRKN